MLGHFRHEVGHYYQWVLVEQTDWIDECRELFGDERASYSDALDRHYHTGAPEGWEASYISEYATMHPWEDFAESFAHYLHITDTLGTAAAGGLVLHADRLDGLVADDVVPRASYHDAPIERDAGRLALAVAAVQPGQPRDGQRRPVPVHPVRTRGAKARLRPPGGAGSSSAQRRNADPHLKPSATTHRAERWVAPG
jgi:hypothetical protein